MFQVGMLEEFGAEVVAGDTLVWDLEEFQVPGVIRKMLKTTKPYEIVQIKCKRKDKMLDHLPDAHGIFKHEYFENFNDVVVFTLQMLQIEQKEYIFKLPIAQKIERLHFLKDVSSQLFKAQKMHKAEKVYKRMHEFFTGENQKGNFAEEDVETEEYKAGLAAIDALKLVNLTNLAVCQIKKAGNSKELNYKAIQYCNEVIEQEP